MEGLKEKFHFRGKPENYARRTLAAAQSRDGFLVEFVTLRNLENPKPPHRILVSVEGRGGPDISLDTLSQLGAGSIELGLKRVVDAVPGVGYADVLPGDLDPIYAEFINPTLGTDPEAPTAS